MGKSYEELLREVRAQVPEVSPAEADARVRAGGVVLVDVREPHEWDAGHIRGALHVPKGSVEERIEAAVPGRDTPVILYCGVGQRSLFAGRTMLAMGYSDVASMAGGIEAWQRDGFPATEPAGGLTDAQRERYSRHLLIPEVGPEGQARLLASRVLLVGAGGLGLAGGAVPRGGRRRDAGDRGLRRRRRVQPAAPGAPLDGPDRDAQDGVGVGGRSRGLNPDVDVVAHEEALVADNVARLIEGYDVVLDGTDTFETRYLLNDAAVIAGIPVVHASVFRFEGQLTVFAPPEGPCYRCLYPTPPPPELAPACSVAGVLGVVPGIMGLLQANEVLKLLLGIGSTLAGRLVLFDALEGEFTELRLRRDPAVPGVLRRCRRGAGRRDAAAAPDLDPSEDAGVFTLGGRTPRMTARAPVHPGPAVARVPAAILDAVVAQARAEQPLEACGLVVGSAPRRRRRRWPSATSRAGTRSRPARGSRSIPTTSTGSRSTPTTPDEVIWAIVHSHPHSAGVPSTTDTRARALPGRPAPARLARSPTAVGPRLADRRRRGPRGRAGAGMTSARPRPAGLARGGGARPRRRHPARAGTGRCSPTIATPPPLIRALLVAISVLAALWCLAEAVRRMEAGRDAPSG